MVMGTDLFTDRLAELKRTLADMNDKFREHLRKVLYDQIQLSERTQNHALMAISVKISESEAILYAFRRRALLVTAEIIEKYFITKSIPLNRNLVSNRYLLDIIALYAYGRAIENGLIAIGQHRRVIYLLEKTYERRPGVKDLARIYSRSIADIVHKENAVRQVFERALLSYIEVIPLRMFNVNVTDTMRAAVEMILETEKLVDQADYALSMEQLVQKYVDPGAVFDIAQVSQKTLATVEQFGSEATQAVRMEDIDSYDQAVVQSRLSGVPTHLSYQYSVRDMNKALHARFQQTMRKLLYERQQVAAKEGNFPLMALSAQMAETEALMYVQEVRMLWILEDLFERNALLVGRLLVTNRKPFDALAQRLINFAIDDGLAMIDSSRKRIYLIEQRYDERPGVKELARDYASGIYSRKTRLIRGEFESKHLIDSFKLEAQSQEQARTLLEVVDGMYDHATEKYRRSNSNIAYLLKSFSEPQVYQTIRHAKNRSANRYVRPSLSETNAVKNEQIYNYEYSLFDPHQGPPGPAEVGTAEASINV